MCLTTQGRHDTFLTYIHATDVSKWHFSVLNWEIQVSFFRKLSLQKLVFLKFYSLNEEVVRSKIRRKDYFIFYSFLFSSIALINLLQQLKPFSLLLKKCNLYKEYLCKHDDLSSSIWCVGSTDLNPRFENNSSVSNCKQVYKSKR